MRDAPLRMFLHATRILTDTKTDTKGDSPKPVPELKNRTTPAFDEFQRVRQYAGGASSLRGLRCTNLVTYSATRTRFELIDCPSDSGGCRRYFGPKIRCA